MFLLIFINLDLIEFLVDYYENTHIIANFWTKYPKIDDLSEYLLHHLCISVTKPGVQYFCKALITLTSPNALIGIYYKNTRF